MRDVRVTEDAETGGPSAAYLQIRRVTTLTVEEARVIKQILDDKDHPTHAGREMPTVDASFLLGQS